MGLSRQPDGSRFTRGPYDYIARKLFTTLKFDCFYVRFLYNYTSSSAHNPYNLSPARV